MARVLEDIPAYWWGPETSPWNASDTKCVYSPGVRVRGAFYTRSRPSPSIPVLSVRQIRLTLRSGQSHSPLDVTRVRLADTCFTPARRCVWLAGVRCAAAGGEDVWAHSQKRHLDNSFFLFYLRTTQARGYGLKASHMHTHTHTQLAYISMFYTVNTNLIFIYIDLTYGCLHCLFRSKFHLVKHIFDFRFNSALKPETSWWKERFLYHCFLYFTVKCYVIHKHTPSRTHSLSHTCTCTHTHSPSLSLTHTHTHTHTHSPSLSHKMWSFVLNVF